MSFVAVCWRSARRLTSSFPTFRVNTADGDTAAPDCAKAGCPETKRLANGASEAARRKLRREIIMGKQSCIPTLVDEKKRMFTASISSPLGPLTARAEDNALTGLWFNDQKHFPADASRWLSVPAHPLFNALQNWLQDYFAGKFREPPFSLRLSGTPFQKAVWELLQKIPYGQTTTYGQIASQLETSRKHSAVLARAVGGAVGHNPISILVPCHRVLGINGKLTGYAGGLDRKRALLRLES
jgi:methylated-DNA-[protein]-cysteine S-methyltransferase